MPAAKLGMLLKQKMLRGQTVFGTFFQYMTNPAIVDVLPDDVSRVCDSFDGVVVPYVEDVEHARRLAAAAIYRPLKGQALEQSFAQLRKR